MNDPRRPSILVLGASGTLGRNIMLAAARMGGSAMGFSRAARGRLMDNDSFVTVAASLAPGSGLVVSCAGLASVAACDRDPMAARRANVDFTLRVAHVCRDLQLPFVWMSTDGLFQATHPPPRYHTPTEQPDPPTAYGRSKLEAERGLHDIGWGHCVRGSFVGPSLGTGRGMLAFVASASRSPERRLHGYTDVWFNPVSTGFLADQLLWDPRYRRPGTSIVHVGCRPAITKHDFLTALVQRAGLDLSVVPASARCLPPCRPLDQSLGCTVWQPLDAVLDECAEALRLETADGDPS